MKPLIVVSGDKEILELAVDCGFEVRGFLDPAHDRPWAGFAALGNDQNFYGLKKNEPALRAVLAIDPCALREKLYEIYRDSLQTLISKAATLSPTARVGEGSIVQMGAKILSDAHIGIATKLNVNAVVHHDCRVGNFCTLAPGSLLLGRVELGDRVYIGSGAIVLPRRKIGSDVMVGAGAVVTHDIPAGSRVMGIPARA